jgi:hypothetical protein
VTGPIVQRVVYSDWGLERREELAEIAGAAGFYVVGPERRLGYTGAMQSLWRYLEGRAQGSYVFSVEDDFLYDRDVDLAPMIFASSPSCGLRTTPGSSRRDPCSGR